MASFLDSEAVFGARVMAVGISSEGARKVTAKGITTLSRLAFAAACQPGVGDDAPFVSFLTDAYGSEPVGTGELASWRRIWFEAHAALVADVRNRLERTEETAPNKLPTQERAARLSALQGRLTGLKIEDMLEPSHALVDALNQMKEDDQLRPLELAACTARQQELQGQKKETFMKVDSAGLLHSVSKQNDVRADLTTEYRVRLALQRRALAMDMVGLARYEQFEEWSDYLFNLLLRPVPDGYAPVSMHQIIEADRQAFLVAARLTRGGILQRPDGTFPLENALSSARSDPMVTSILQPLPKPAVPLKRAAREEDAYGERPGKAARTQSSSKTKGKGKGSKSTPRQAPVPKALAGLHGNTPQGDRICYNYNLSGCSLAGAGASCAKGKHVCAKCFESHPVSQCKDAQSTK